MGQFGPAGLIFEGTQFDREHRYLLRESYELLDHALIILKHNDYFRWKVLHGVYLSDPADPSLVDHWRSMMHKSENARHSVEMHDAAVWELTEILLDHDLYCVQPARMTSNEEKQVERRNDELYGLYLQLRKEGETKTKSVRQAADWCGYAERRAWDIVKMREGSKQDGSPRQKVRAFRQRAGIKVKSKKT